MPGRGVPDPSLLRANLETRDPIARLLSLVPRQRPPLAPHGDIGLGSQQVLPPGPRYRPPGLSY